MTGQGDGHSEGDVIRVTITPQPTDEEAAAIVAVVTALAPSGRRGEASVVVREDRWQVAGRLEAMRSPDWPPHSPDDRR